MKKIEIDLKYNYVPSKPSSVSWFDLYVNFFVSVVLAAAGLSPAGRPPGENEVFLILLLERGGESKKFIFIPRHQKLNCLQNG